jgi:hypothetical protein
VPREEIKEDSSESYTEPRPNRVAKVALSIAMVGARHQNSANGLALADEVIE